MRILLLTLYFPPLNTIASQRMSAFQSCLSKEGHHVDVISRFYDEEQQKGNSMFLGKISPSGLKVSYIKKENIIYTNFSEENPKLSLSKKLPPGIRGFYNYYQLDVWHYGWMPFALEAFEKEYSSNSYDVIIASYGPPIVMRLAKELSMKYNIPYLIDFRDSYIDERDRSVHLWMKQRIQHHYLKDARGLIFSTAGMYDFFLKNASSQLRKLPSCIVYNGVDDKMVQVIENSDEPTLARFADIQRKHSLVFLHTGTLYKGQNIDFFVKGIKEYNSIFKGTAAIVFLGLVENDTLNLDSETFLFFLPKVSHAASLKLQKEATALLLPIWDGRYTGFSGKTQEYLFSENIVITSPDPQEDLMDFLADSPNVLIPENNHSLQTFIERISGGEIKPNRVHNKEKLYRSYWLNNLVEFLSGKNE